MTRTPTPAHNTATSSSRLHGICRSPSLSGGFRNTAGPSGELSVGDVVAAGDVLLAVGRPAGWEPVTGPLAEVRTREHGTNPLPDCGWPSGTEGEPA